MNILLAFWYCDSFRDCKLQLFGASYDPTKNIPRKSLGRVVAHAKLFLGIVCWGGRRVGVLHWFQNLVNRLQQYDRFDTPSINTYTHPYTTRKHLNTKRNKNHIKTYKTIWQSFKWQCGTLHIEKL